MGRLSAWLAALGLLTLGSLTAHSLAYRIVEPGEPARADLLQSTGHAYLAAAPLIAGTGLALALAALLSLVVRARRGAADPPPGWPLALMPPVGFVVQEQLERALAGADWGLAAALEPTFLVGLALQIPFALVALALARRLTETAVALGRSLVVAPPKARPEPLAPIPDETLLVPQGTVALGYAGRAPPS